MAEVCFKDLDPFNCPICLDALQDPVTIPCGHNYCMGCVKDYWDKKGGKDGGYSCPQCRKTFSPRPVLNKNTMFAEVVERFKNTGLQDSPPTHYNGPGHTVREICTAKKLKPLKMCPESEDSSCKIHLRYHNNDYPREKRTVIVSIKDIKCFQGHLRRQKRSGVKRKQLDMVGDHLIRGFMVLSIDMGIGVDIPEAHVLKEAMKHTVVDTEAAFVAGILHSVNLRGVSCSGKTIGVRGPRKEAAWLDPSLSLAPSRTIPDPRETLAPAAELIVELCTLQKEEEE
ncbi:tripartite motif-containing protein [Pimephales promelas]|nr:tripartite motif-containing protein [Pimephales promelas]